MISSKGRMFLVAWTVGLLILSALGGYFVADQFKKEVSNPAQNESDFSYGQSTKEDPNSESRNATDAAANPIKVLTGVYIDRIPSLSIKDGVWETEFYIWFRWNGSNIDPGENLQVINGEIVSKIREENVTSEQGRYEEYRIIADISKVFDVTRFPLDADQLTLEFEDNLNSSNYLVYVPDTMGSRVNPSIRIPGYEITNLSITETPHYYMTNFGNPIRRDTEQCSYSRLSFDIGIERPGWGWFFKIFQGLFLAVAISMLVFFIRPDDGDKRVSLGVGAAFAAVANFYISSSLMPETDMMTLADMINGIGIVFVFFSLVQSTISLHLYDQMEEKELSRLYDWSSAGIFFVSYMGINLALVLTAR